MKATTLGIIALFILVGTYLYVMAMCYLCDLYDRRQNVKREEEEKRRKRELQRVIEETELRKRADLERRRRAAEERRQRIAPPQAANRVQHVLE